MPTQKSSAELRADKKKKSAISSWLDEGSSLSHKLRLTLNEPRCLLSKTIKNDSIFEWINYCFPIVVGSGSVVYAIEWKEK